MRASPARDGGRAANWRASSQSRASSRSISYDIALVQLSAATTASVTPTTSNETRKMRARNDASRSFTPVA